MINVQFVLLPGATLIHIADSMSQALSQTTAEIQYSVYSTFPQSDSWLLIGVSMDLLVNYTPWDIITRVRTGWSPAMLTATHAATINAISIQCPAVALHPTDTDKWLARPAGAPTLEQLIRDALAAIDAARTPAAPAPASSNSIWSKIYEPIEA